MHNNTILQMVLKFDWKCTVIQYRWRELKYARHCAIASYRWRQQISFENVRSYHILRHHEKHLMLVRVYYHKMWSWSKEFVYIICFILAGICLVIPRQIHTSSFSLPFFLNALPASPSSIWILYLQLLFDSITFKPNHAARISNTKSPMSSLLYLR